VPARDVDTTKALLNEKGSVRDCNGS
jgi:hypothetical protein